ncbi:MAG: GspH/FimT family pseudopilin [Gammaproteobacteria bacterium]|nr:GspH/FimT family pseudopilin [Gammaproteobacteria bacterium]
MKKAHTGFTLIELLIALTIGGLLLGLAVPSFTNMMRNNRLTTEANNLVTAFNIARSEAINRRGTITVCPSTNQTSCNGDSWDDGWIVLVDATDDVVQVFSAMKGHPTIDSTADSVQYTAGGFLNGGAAVSIGICMEGVDQGRQINITATGRPNNVTPYPEC